MSRMQTDLRETVESARRIRFEPSLLNSATNVQDAIGQAGAIFPTNVTVGMSPYTPAATDQLLLVDTSAGAVTINLAPSASRILPLEIKDKTGNADVNVITINRNGAETIDTQVSVPIDSKFGAIKMVPKTGGYALV